MAAYSRIIRDTCPSPIVTVEYLLRKCCTIPSKESLPSVYTSYDVISSSTRTALGTILEALERREPCTREAIRAVHRMASSINHPEISILGF